MVLTRLGSDMPSHKQYLLAGLARPIQGGQAYGHYIGDELDIPAFLAGEAGTAGADSLTVLDENGQLSGVILRHGSSYLAGPPSRDPLGATPLSRERLSNGFLRLEMPPRTG